MSKFYLIGVGGAGVSALGHYLLDTGSQVTGYDVARSWELKYLLKRNINFYENTFNLNDLNNYDIFVKTIAVSDNMPILQAAKILGKKIYDYPQYLGDRTKNHKKVIAICGAHGKTTVAGLTAYLLTRYNLNPSYIVGGIISNFHRNGGFGSSDFLVVEACEFRESFLNLTPHIIIATNIEMDHTDYYDDINKLKNAYLKFFQKDSVEYIIYNKDSQILVELMEQIKHKTKIAFSSSSGEDCYSFSNFSNGAGINFLIKKNSKDLLSVESHLPGIHNAYNLTAAFALCDILNCETKYFSNFVRVFEGIERRMQKIKVGNYLFILDYAHHPTQLSSVILSLKKMVSENFLVVFQPHQLRRLTYFEKEFLAIFKNINNLILTPVFKAREETDDGMVMQQILNNIKKDNKGNHHYLHTYADIADYIKASGFKTILLAGAGDIYRVLDFFDNTSE